MGTIRRIIVTAVVAAFFAFHSSPSVAHAVLIEAFPAAGSMVAGSEIEARLRYNARIDHERSSLTLIGPNGQTQVDTGSATAPPDVMTGKLIGLTPGKYRLRWQVLAVDGHITRGDIEFEVRAR